MSRGAYLLGCVELAVLVGALAFAAFRLRQLLLPELARSPARLAETVLALSLFVVLSEALGAIGLLEEAPLLLGSVLIAAGAVAAARPRAALRSEGTQPVGSPEGLALAGAAVGALVLARWLIPVQAFLDEGMWAFDTMAYHMPMAAGFAQSGTVTSLHQVDPVDVVWFYPANSEHFHAAGLIVVDRDILSPLINLGWLGLALLAAWCLGRPFGVGLGSMSAVGIVLVSPLLLARQPGNAHSDIAGIALLLAGAAVLLSAYPGGDRGPARPDAARLAAVSVAGFAAGLAVGTKLSLVVPVAALSLGILAIAPAAALGRVALAWFLPLAATGGFWYLRNLIATGNPLPFFDRLGPINVPAPDRVVELPPDFTVSHYLGDGRMWSDFFLPGLNGAFGDLWPGLLALALGGGLVCALDRGGPARQVLGVTAIAAVIGYLFTPLSAAGAEGSPSYFEVNLRFLAPGLALGLALLPTVEPLRRPAVAPWVAALLAGALLYTAGLGISADAPGLGWAVAIGLAAGAVAAGLALGAARLRPLELGVAAALVAVLAVSFYYRPSRDYLSQRYTNVWPGLYLNESFGWAKDVSGARIGLAGTAAAFFQYGYYGDGSTNVVRYLARSGPKGAFNPIQSCREWRAAVNDGHYDYLVTSPTIAPGSGTGEGGAPEGEWVDGDPNAEQILADGPTSVFRLTGPLDPDRCPADAPTGLPLLLQPHDPA